MSQEVKQGARVIRIIDYSTRKDSETDFKKLTFNEILEGFVALKDAPVLLNMKNRDYVRRLLLEGKLEGIKIEHLGRPKWLVSKDSIEYYKTHNAKKVTHRRYLLRMNSVHEEAVRNFLTTSGIEHTLELAYKPKPTNNDEGWPF